MKTALLIYIFFSSTLFSFGQSGTGSSSFLSKLYFPFEFGYLVSEQKSIKPGNLNKTGIEYRFKKQKGLFIRFNFDNRSTKFNITENQTTNVIEGKIKFNDYLLGLGYRFGKKKLKPFGLLQTGLSSYEFLKVAGPVNNFKVQDHLKTIVINKMMLGIDYYIVPTAALTLEGSCFLHPGNSVFWNKGLYMFGVSVGLTTTLF